jgi:class 3 adenylate cyclase
MTRLHVTARAPADRWQVAQLHDEHRPSASAADAASATFLFADIAGYTALTEAHGDEQAADLVPDFFKAVSEELPTWGGTHVKTIGDALMLRIPDPAQAVALGLRISHELLQGDGVPQYASAFTTERRSSATATTSALPSISPLAWPR